jgi:hypothetical protein
MPRRKTEDETTGPVTAVRLTRKFADVIDGVDLRDAKVGDELKLPPHDADVLVAEGWAELTRPPRRRADDLQANTSDDRPSRRRAKS